MSDSLDLDHRFPDVGLDAWRARAEGGGQLTERPLLDGPSVRTLYTEASPARALRGRPGTPPFLRGATASGGWRLVHELDARSGCELADLVDGVAKAAGHGAEEVRVEAAACRCLTARADLEALVAAAGEVPLTLAPGEDAEAFAALGLGVTVLSDPLGALARGGLLPVSPRRALRRLADRVAAERGARPTERTVEIDLRPYHEAGATAVEELALALASGVEVLRSLSDAGHPLADIPLRARFAFALDPDVFVGVAKLRAARLGWSKVLRTLGVDGPEQGMRIHASGSRRASSRLDPLNNLLRGTASAFAAAVGGADSIAVLPHDVAETSVNPHADRLARNTQLLLLWESHLGRVLDPAGGSYFVESLTEDLARRAWPVFQEIEHAGGVSRGLLDGSIRDRLRASAEVRLLSVATRRRGLVGVSRYPSREDPTFELEGHLPNEMPQGAMKERGLEGGSSVDPLAGELGAWWARFAADGRDLAELREALRRGEAPCRVAPLAAIREAEAFERLRVRAAALPEDKRRAVVLPIGEATKIKARVEYAREALEVAGLRVTVVDPRADAEAGRAALAEGPPAALVCLCATDDELAATLEGLVEGLGDAHLVVAGAPDDGLRATGARAFLHRRMNALETLGGLLDALSEAAR